jgi:hypothetical protein
MSLINTGGSGIVVVVEVVVDEVILVVVVEEAVDEELVVELDVVVSGPKSVKASEPFQDCTICRVISSKSVGGEKSVRA